jgi:lipopolysaccharide export system protein LptC
LARSIGPTSSAADLAIPQARYAASERAEAFGRAARHSRRVRRLKFLLPAVALAMGGVFVFYSYILPSAPIDVDADSASISEGKLVMANPKLEGFTKNNQPYSMTAERAVQEFDEQGVVNLEGISAKMPVEAGNWAEVTADRGVYDRTKHTIELNTNVVVTTTDGMSARLNTAFLDIDKGTMTSGDPVDIQMKGSTVTADSMSVLENGKIVVFDRRVRMNIEPGQVKSAQQASGGTNASN